MGLKCIMPLNSDFGLYGPARAFIPYHTMDAEKALLHVSQQGWIVIVPVVG